MSPELLVGLVLAASLVAYVLFGGADFGGGVWDLFASGSRKQAQRDAIERAIGPIWEANHVWLILAIVLLFSGFPKAFAALCTRFHVPLTLFLFGIVFRGSAFVFRHALSDQPVPRKRWGRVFSLASIASPFVLGTVVAGAATGESADLFAFSVGAMTLSLCAFLAATYLSKEIEGELRRDFQKRASAAAIALGVTSLVAFLTAPHSFKDRLTGRPESWLMIALTIASLSATVVLLRRERVALARITAGATAVLLLGGWIASQYPYLLYPDFTVQGAAANPTTLKLMLFALAGGSVLLLPSLYVMFRVFKGPSPESASASGER